MKKVLACMVIVCGCVAKVCAEPLPLVPNYTQTTKETTKATTTQKTTEKTTQKGSEKTTQSTTAKTQETEKPVIAKQSNSVEENIYKRYEEYFNKDKSDDIEKRIMLSARQIESASSKTNSYRVKNAMANTYIEGESEPTFLSVLGAKDNFLGVDFGNGKRNYSVDQKENSINIDGVYFY